MSMSRHRRRLLISNADRAIIEEFATCVLKNREILGLSGPRAGVVRVHVTVEGLSSMYRHCLWQWSQRDCEKYPFRAQVSSFDAPLVWIALFTESEAKKYHCPLLEEG